MAKGGEPKILNSYRLQFGMNKRGFIFPLKLFVTFFYDHLVSELLFSSMLLRIRNSYEYMILNKGGWIADLSEGFYCFLKETLGYSNLTLENLKGINIALFSTILLQYIANYENEGRGDQKITAV